MRIVISKERRERAEAAALRAVEDAWVDEGLATPDAATIRVAVGAAIDQLEEELA